MNDTPHLMAIVESKVAQMRTNLEHNNPAKTHALMAEVETYMDDIRRSLPPGDLPTFFGPRLA